jgi:hypothetical protein
MVGENNSTNESRGPQLARKPRNENLTWAHSAPIDSLLMGGHTEKELQGSRANISHKPKLSSYGPLAISLHGPSPDWRHRLFLRGVLHSVSILSL